MSFMAFFDSFFTTGSSREENQVEARKVLSRAVERLDIDVAIAAHKNWKYRLYAALENKEVESLDPEKIACDHCCDLGKWIYGAGDEHLGTFAAFTELRATHQMFHYSASNVALLLKSNKRDEAETLLKGEFERLSHRIHSTLKDLKSLTRAA